jgi:hypothetical protein
MLLGGAASEPRPPFKCPMTLPSSGALASPRSPRLRSDSCSFLRYALTRETLGSSPVLRGELLPALLDERRAESPSFCEGTDCDPDVAVEAPSGVWLLRSAWLSRYCRVLLLPLNVGEFGLGVDPPDMVPPMPGSYWNSVTSAPAMPV